MRQTTTYHPLSFLFIVNELVFDLDRLRNRHPLTDEWSNTVPPTHHSAYTSEIPSPVMRYSAGRISEAPGYTWRRPPRPHRGHPFPPGYLTSSIHARPVPVPVRAHRYKALSVFSCNPLLPIVVVEGDPSAEPNARQHPLLFFHPQDERLRGVSQAVTEDSPMERSNGGVVKFAAGRVPSWIPGLVPETYRNPERDPPLSMGLAGELPVVIGLMAFCEPRDGTGEGVRRTFLGGGGQDGRWRDGLWLCHEAPRGYSLSTRDDPRGFLVVVFLDPENVQGSTRERLHQMEWFGVIVHEAWSICDRFV